MADWSRFNVIGDTPEEAAQGFPGIDVDDSEAWRRLADELLRTSLPSEEEKRYEEANESILRSRLA